MGIGCEQGVPSAIVPKVPFHCVSIAYKVEYILRLERIEGIIP